VTTFDLALIRSENERLTQLAQVPLSLLRGSTRDADGRFDEYIYAWVETLQSFWLGREDMSEKLVAAVEGTNPQVITGDSELTLKVLYPPLNLFYRFLRRDAEQFNQALVEAVTWHKEYWPADEDRAISIEGLVALGPLAMVCIARDAGMPIEVESEYLPKELIEFGWAGEIDT
jgi:hypothetical protein